MRFHYGAVPEDVDFHPEAEGWCDIHEPGPIMLQVLAVPVAIGLLLIWGVLVFVFARINPFGLQMHENADAAALCLTGLGLIIVLIPLHELLHALVHPGWGLSSGTIIGLWLSKGLFYAHYGGSMSRNRFLLILIMPYLVLGVLPIILMGIWPMATLFFLLFSLWGSVLACGDLVGVGLILFQIPNSSAVRNKGWKTYWKSASG